MKKILIGLAFVAVAFVPSATMAASLTGAQVSAIMSVLAAFGVDQTTLANVYNDLTQASATSTPAVATSTPSVVAPTFSAATSTVIAPSYGNVCSGPSCITYAAPTTVPSSGSVATKPVCPTTVGWSVRTDGSCMLHACIIRDKNGSPVAPGQFTSTTTTDYNISCVVWDTVEDAKQNGWYFAPNPNGVAGFYQDIQNGISPQSL